MTHRPRIAVLLDENTSVDGTRYDMTKNYFRAIASAGGLPFGIPYHSEIIDITVSDFDGLLAVGGRFAYPDDWFISAQSSKAPASERLPIERALMQGYLQRQKPILGICAGMQMLACLHGCRMTPDLRAAYPDALEHDKRGQYHRVDVAPGSTLARAIGASSLSVNSFHREAVVELSDQVVASGRAEDGIIEAIEIPSHPFAIGVQWHQEAFALEDHPGNSIFKAFVEASRQA